MPKRAESNRGAPNVIISMAQQARPNVAGHNDDLRVQLTSFSTLASRMPSGSFSSRPTSVLASLWADAGPQPHYADSFAHFVRSWAQSQSKPPRRQTYAYATNTVAMNKIISTNPNRPSARFATAHGYRKMISMSKMMKIIAVRKYLIGNRCGPI